MSGKTIVDQIRHYQKDIERCPDNSERMIRCIQRLYVLPIQVLHLQETGVGRSVNSLRKYKGEVGDAAKALVAKWKAMVAAEESSDDSNDKLKTKSAENKVNKLSTSVKIEPKSENNVVKLEAKSEKPTVKSEPKSDKLDNVITKDKSSSKEKYSGNDKYSSQDRASNKDKPSVKSHHNSSRHHETHSSSQSHSSSLKRSHSSSERNSVSEKKNGSHKSHKSSRHEKRHASDDEDSPRSKKYKHHSHSRNHSHSKKEEICSEGEEEPADSPDEDDRCPSEADDSSSNSEKDSTEDSENSSAEEEEDEEEDQLQDSDNNSSDNRHRSKHKSSSHHKHRNSSHSDKNKENQDSHKISSSRQSNKKSSKDSKSASQNLDELIKENEKKIKKEKDEFEVPKYIPTKIVKVERNEDGSIDSGSGASFADALLGMDNYVDKKKKKKSRETSSNHKAASPQNPSSSSSSSNNHKKSHGHSSRQESRSTSKEKMKDNSSSKPRPIDELVETPELLTKKVKLEALDLDISSTLPEINPNYKPLPHVPETSRRQTKTMSEEDTMFSIMTTKNQRTKVYSGNKVYQSTIPSLFNLCIQLLYENIDAVEYTGGVPYNILKPLLERLNSDQLYVIEHFNPYLIEDTDNLWKFHCSKDFRSERRQDMESWRDLYLRCLEERERKLKALTANISQSMAKSTPVRQAKLAYVDSVVKPPRNVARKQAKYGTGSSSSNLKSSTSNSNKQEIVSKAIVGGHTPGVSAKDVVPPPPTPRAVHHSTPAVLKKKKAPLMQKALQFIKGNRYKR